MKFLTSLFAALMLATSVNASTLTIVASEVGGDVVLTGSGSVDLSDASLFSLGVSFPPTSDQSADTFYAGASQGLANSYAVNDFISFTSLGSQQFNLTATGDVFGYQGLVPSKLDPFLIVAADYVSGSAINFTWTVAGATIAGLGLNFGVVGEYGTSTGTGQIVLSAAVPLPAPALLLLGGLGVLGLARRRRGTV